LKSNIAIKSNLILDHPDYKPVHRYLPGDFVKKIYPGMVDTRTIESALSKRQIVELEQYLVCILCGMPCAGTCGKKL